MEKADQFVKAFTGSDVTEITATARKLWSDVVQTPKTLITCIAITMTVLLGASALLTEYYCDCGLPGGLVKIWTAPSP